MSADLHPGASRLVNLPTRDVCRACRAFAAECLVPVGDGAARLCWACAHMVADHGHDVADAAGARCGCPPTEVYPADVRPDLGWRCDDCGAAGEPVGGGCQACAGEVSTAVDREVERLKAEYADRIWDAEQAMRARAS